MTWTRLSDDFADSPQILAVSHAARWLHIEALIWCNRHTTEGAVPSSALRKVTGSEHAGDEIAELVAAGIWTVSDDGWRIDWSDQEPADRVLTRKRRNAANQAAFRDRVARCRDGDHSLCGDNRHCPRSAAQRGNGTAGGVSDDVSDDQSGYVTAHVSGSRPVPSRPVPTPREGSGSGHGEPGGPDGPGAGAPDRRPPPAAGKNWRKTGSNSYAVET